jgi:hypothetical protein
MNKKIYIAPRIEKHNVTAEDIICQIAVSSTPKSNDGQLSKGRNDWGDIWGSSDSSTKDE